MVKNDKISFFGLPLSWFERDDSKRLWKRWLKITAMTPDGLLDLYEDARAGDEPSHEVMCELIRWHHHKHVEMPPPLATYDMQVVRAASNPEIQAPPAERGKRGSPPSGAISRSSGWSARSGGNSGSSRIAANCRIGSA